MLLKRGFGATIDEWLMAAEYILSSGNSNVVLCERGIRTFETSTRNTLDVTAVPVLRERTHLPVMIDPSHGTGHRPLVRPMALAGAAAGADGVIIEVHPDPPRAKSDSEQSLSFPEFGDLMDDLRRLEFLRGSTAIHEVPSRVPAGIDGFAARSTTSTTGWRPSSRSGRAWRCRSSGHDVRAHTATTSARERELVARATSGDRRRADDGRADPGVRGRSCARPARRSDGRRRARRHRS